METASIIVGAICDGSLAPPALNSSWAPSCIRSLETGSGAEVDVAAGHDDGLGHVYDFAGSRSSRGRGFCAMALAIILVAHRQSTRRGKRSPFLRTTSCCRHWHAHLLFADGFNQLNLGATVCGSDWR